MMKKIGTFFILITISFLGYSQEPNDASSPTAICGDIDFAYTPTGPGNDDFLTNPNPTCLPNDPVESQSIWLELPISVAGTLEFSLIPNNGTDDYDWSVYDITTAAPNTLGDLIRCSSTMFLPPNGETGIGNGAVDTVEGPGTGDGFLAPINANAGDVFLLFINNWSGSTSGFNLSFGGTAAFNPPPTSEVPVGMSINLVECDNDGTLDNMTNFDLTIHESDIIGTQTGITVTYHTTQGNAQIGATDILDFTNFINTIAGGQTIYARITNTGTDCFDVIEFELNVLDGLTAFTPPKINECDDNNDGFWNFDLTQSDVAIINGQPNVQVSYYDSFANADSGMFPITGLFPNTSNPQFIWARMESTTNTCYRVERFDIEVHNQPTAVQPTNMVQCDDDNNGTMNFDLSLQDATILNGQSATIFETLYFTDATYTTQIPRSATPVAGNDVTDYTNNLGLTVNGIQPIYARVQNINNTNCIADTNFDLEIYESAFPLDTANILPIGECDNDDDADDTNGFIIFDLTTVTDLTGTIDILNGQAAADFTLTYYTGASRTTAFQIPENVIPVVGNDITSFQNTVTNGQTIYVRMTNNLNTNCSTDTSFDVEVYPLPVLLTNLITLIQCNDDLTLIEAFNLRLKEDEISVNFAVETFTYYETFAEADAGVAGTEIATPTSYPNQVADFDTVWVRVETTDGCHRVAQIDLDVEPSSAVMSGFVTRDFSECDDGADNRDGVATFDFSSVTTDIQTLFAPVVVDVLYYETEAQANQGLVADQLDATNYDNTSQDQLIWAQIVSISGSDCLAKGQYVQLHVEALPTANAPTTVMKQCDDDQDGIFPFDTSMITSEILNGQSLADVTITYFNEDGTPITGVINSSLPNPFSTISQTIDIVLTNNVTNDPDGACTDATTLTFIVDTLPINNVQPIPPMCETDPEDGLLIATFDTSNLESSINAQAGMDITYIDSNGNPLQDIDGNLIVSPFPTTFTTETQTITVVVTNPANVTCPASVDVDFIVNPRPIFDDLDDDIVCSNILPHEIMVTNPDATNYAYEWFNTTGTSIGTGQTLSIIDATDISTTGVMYSVTVTNPTTGCTRTKTINLKKSSIATLLDADIVTIEFNSPTNSIEIITTNLGFGDYEFALQHDADSRPWQDEPIFTDLQGGVYTVLINDKNDCGEISKVLFLLDYPKFLTPNNDGHNDYWQLIGLNSTTFTISPIQIFDRFGKIVAIINPTQGQGWDGLYNNENLPSSDYWFVLSLTDNLGETKIHKGHFSLVRR